MLKKILNLEGAEELNANEQKSIIGGNAPICEIGFFAKRCTDLGSVPPYWSCLPIGWAGPC